MGACSGGCDGSPSALRRIRSSSQIASKDVTSCTKHTLSLSVVHKTCNAYQLLVPNDTFRCSKRKLSGVDNVARSNVHFQLARTLRRWTSPKPSAPEDGHTHHASGEHGCPHILIYRLLAPKGVGNTPLARPPTRARSTLRPSITFKNKYETTKAYLRRYNCALPPFPGLFPFLPQLLSSTSQVTTEVIVEHTPACLCGRGRAPCRARTWDVGR